MKIFSFDKEALLEELNNAPKWAMYKKKMVAEDEELQTKFEEDCTGCNNPSSTFYVLADTEDEAKELIFKCQSGMCGDCMATMLAEPFEYKRRKLGFEIEKVDLTTAPEGKEYKVPVCANCGEPLVKVYFNDYTTYTFKEKTGRYENTGGDADTKCPECETKLGDELGDFVGDYQATRLIKAKLQVKPNES